MDFTQFAFWLLCGLLASFGSLGLVILSKLVQSVEALNVKIAVIIEKIDTHEKRITKLESNK
jgi:hypothetical protein